MRVQVKEVPVTEEMPSRIANMVESFNRSVKSVMHLDFDSDASSLEELEEMLEHGLYEVVFPDTVSGRNLKEVVMQIDTPLFKFKVSDLYVEESFIIIQEIIIPLFKDTCERHGYYTMGTSADYCIWLKQRTVLLTGARLHDIAENVKKYSDTEDTVYDIATVLLDECTVTSIKTEISD